jgi:hypothetical protein
MGKLLANACTTATMPSFAQLLLLLFFNLKLTIHFSFKKLTFNEQVALLVGNIIDGAVIIHLGTNQDAQLLIKRRPFWGN